MRRFAAVIACACIGAACTSGSHPTVRSAEALDDDPPAPGSPADSVPTADTTNLDWEACTDGPDLLAGELDCATLTVPLNYDEPDGRQIDIAVARLATDTDERIGSLVVNPGGPGGSGIDYLQQLTLVIPSAITQAFDLVSFDPRGVAASTAFDCEVEYDDEVELIDDVDSPAWDALVDENTEDLHEQCPADAIELLPHLGTTNAARDMDRLRGALGDEQLTYLGYSYGTRLGATYAELFPERIRAMVLDGGMVPSLDLERLTVGQGAGFDRAFESFADACDADADCAVNGDRPTLEVIGDLEADLGPDGEVPTDLDGRVLTAGELQISIVASLYSAEMWPYLALGIAEAVDGDGSTLQAIADRYMGRELDGGYDNFAQANGAINCADQPERPTLDEARDDAEFIGTTTEYFGSLLRASTGCYDVPESAAPLTIGPAVGAPPILVIGTTGDPATPYEWSVELADTLESGVLYTVEGEGHTAYLSHECVDEVVHAYLIDLEVPDAGASCVGAEPTTDYFPAETEAEQLVAFIDCLRDNGADMPEPSIATVLADPFGERLFGDVDLNDPASAPTVLPCIGELPTG